MERSAEEMQPVLMRQVPQWGSIGLFVFALLVWRFIPDHKSWFMLAGATLAWLAVSVLMWHLRKRAYRIRRRLHGH